ncbi:alpha-ribazole phosphatase [Hymenobacter oligotrophus]|uniref:Alpha-ribazole phosphatase n=1 Tax=Hymenobacter oligotrophus TaxID=2319843 RepID=A0A3B7R7Y2_9BACT|nr:alpha-ribazole phosphatase family protein [Hymenobacter oligotrophus]AYA35766.1 alpha-ribazole phosphatase [Hymenobacter oligotrophus]
MAAPLLDVYLIRHTAVATPGLCYGHHDVGLAESFRDEVAALQTKLPAAPGQGFRAFTSPSSRCQQLAHTVAGTATPDERLREMHFGVWENRLWSELPETELTPWMADYVTVAPPAGETFQQLQDRATEFLAELPQLPAHAGPVLVFTHGGVIRAMLAHCLGYPLRNAFQVTIDFASVTQLTHQHGRWQVRTVNR